MGASSSGPVLVIVGPTASGKSALALELAKRFAGEIICADSRTVYHDLDIGTAKPSLADQQRVPHHLLDVTTPNQAFTVADFQRLANAAIADIQGRGRLPILVGGTGLYIDSVLYDYQFRPPAEPSRRAELNGYSLEQLTAELQARQLPLPTNPLNRRHLIRILETDGAFATASATIRPQTLVLGLQPDKQVLDARITARVDAMVADGLIDEVQRLMAEYDWSTDAFRTPGYSSFRRYLQGELTLDEAKALFAQADRQLAKRQRTWFKRNKSIHWLITDDVTAESVDLVTTFLNK